jgi:uncharacterized protein (TIGR00255 family)
MSVRSMTGFARVRRATPQGELTVSLKSVNHRGLDLHFHMPPELDALENDIRTAVKNGMARGHVQIHVSLMRAPGFEKAPVNWGVLDAYMTAFREAAARYDVEATPDLNAALAFPGVLSGDVAEGETDEELAREVLAAVAEAIAVLNQFREREGAVTAREMRQRCESIEVLVKRMEEIRAGAVPAFQKRLRDKLADLLHGVSVDPQRLAQEAALLADRSDIAEELIRLRTHAGQVDSILAGKGEVGKRLDFLLQEMNRESNTVLSKTGGLGDLGLTITELALAAKSEIDKIREQSLNLE